VLGRRQRFAGAKFTGLVSFAHAKFSGSTVWFPGAEFSGGMVGVASAEFSGGTVDFSDAGIWSHPPIFDFAESSPSVGVLLPPTAAADLASD
jgi:hypothetical protein